MPLKNNIDQAKDTGLAIVLILLIIEYSKGPNLLPIAAMAVLVPVMMIRTSLFRTLAKIWFGNLHTLNKTVNVFNNPEGEVSFNITLPENMKTNCVTHEN